MIEVESGEPKKVTHARNEETLQRFFGNNTKYKIPLYQRRYTWDKTKIDQVIKDFDEILDGEKSVHFFGAAIFYVEPERTQWRTETYEIIDGQQRITTIFIFLLAFVYVLRKNSGEDAELVFIESLVDIKSKQSNSRLITGKEDMGQLNWIFSQIVKSTEFNDSLKFKYLEFPSEKDSKSSGKLKNAYSQFRKYLERKIEKIETKEERTKVLIELYNQILNSCTMVSINIREKQNGPMIFDALNSKQEPITVGELIKNALFARNKNMTIAEMQQIHDCQWYPFVNKFQLEKTNALEKYLFPYGLIHNIYLKKNDTYKSIVNSWDKEKQADEIIEDLSEYQDAFMAINGGSLDMYSKKLGKAINTIFASGFPSSCNPFFMRLLRAVETNPNFENEAIKIFNSIESFLVRRQVCNEEPTGLHAVFKRLWHDLEESGQGITASSVINYIKTPLKRKTVKFISDEEFYKGIKENPIYKKRIDKFLLVEYDKHFGGELKDYSDITIEHVLPKNDYHWTDKFSSEEYLKYVDIFANLVPLTGEFNSSGGNKKYSDKRKLFINKSKCLSTRRLFETFEDWNPTNVEKRAEEIAKWALERWKY